MPLTIHSLIPAKAVRWRLEGFTAIHRILIQNHGLDQRESFHDP